MFGLPHLVGVLGSILFGYFMLRVNRSPSLAAQKKQRINIVIAWVLLLSVVMDPLLIWLRFGENPRQAQDIIREIGLPFYLCDVVSVIMAIALMKNTQRLAEIGYLWGVAGTVQGLITPTLTFSWDCPEYYAFFFQHGGVPAAAIALTFGAKIQPQAGAFRRAMFWSWGYMSSVYCCNMIFGANYGFLNGKPDIDSLFDFMGPYPWYLITLQVVAFSLYFLLLLPFRKMGKPVAS